MLAAALLGATLGGLGAMGYFFWANREMCPCAPVGIDSVEQAVAVPMTDGVQRGVWIASIVGAVVSVGFAALWVVPPALRMHRIENS